MSFVSKSLLASAAILFSSSLPVFSQQLAEEVIEEYFNELRQSGASVEPGIKTVSGKTVEWAEIIFTAPNGVSATTIDFIRAEQIGGDQVSVSFPDTMEITSVAKGDAPAVKIKVDLSGLDYVISGKADARQHVYSADMMKYDVTAEDNSFTAQLALTNLSGNQTHSGTETRNFKGAFKSDSFDLTYSLKQDAMNISADMSYADLAVAFDVDSVKKEEMTQLLTGERGFSFDISVGGGKQTTKIDQPEFKGDITTLVGSGSGSFSALNGIFKMLATSKDISYELKFTEIPLPPFSADMDSVTVSMEMPLKKADEVLPANLLMNLTGVKASDTLWGMIDPTGSLPRDKANLNIDLTANMKWLVDLAMMSEAPGMPAEVQNVAINDITLEIAGARLNGVGSAVIDNNKFPPEPVGTVDLDLKGGIGLLDKLVALGLVPEQQGQMAKMFSGMFALPGGNGADHLTSKIEMKTGGSILVNGQQVK